MENMTENIKKDGKNKKEKAENLEKEKKKNQRKGKGWINKNTGVSKKLERR